LGLHATNRLSPTLAARWRLGVVKVAPDRHRTGLLNEHAILAGPTHPHLIRRFSRAYPGTSVADLRYDNRGRLALALEYAGDTSLARLLQKRAGRALPAQIGLILAYQTALALQHLHEQIGVIHHDVKPANLIVQLLPTGKPHAVLIDLGAADELGCRRRSAIYGSRPYLAPEHLRADPLPPDVQSDIYSLGRLLQTMLSGSPNGTMAAITHPCALEINRLIAAATQNDPVERRAALPSMACFAQALAKLARVT
jgi:serine/threonine protein kinase